MATIKQGVQYALDVIKGSILTSKYTKYACERFIHDLETQDERPIYFDEDDAQHVLDFFDFLKHHKGKWAGEVIQLEPWQVFILINLFGWKREDGSRRFRHAHIEVCRKNGKTTLAAGIALYMMIADAEGGPEIYSAATRREQAKICFDYALQMVRKSPELRSRITVLKYNMHILEDAAKFEPLSSDYNTLDGLNPHCVIYDETHAWKDWFLWDVLESAQGSRWQPLNFEITTAGDEILCVAYENREYLIKILEGYNVEGGFNDDSVFGVIYTLDDEDDWKDPSVWIKANPNLGISVSLEYLKQQCQKAIEMAHRRPGFMIKHLNIWTQSESRWLDIFMWDESGIPFTEEDLEGRECYLGLDLSSKIDLAGYVLFFHPVDEEDDWKFLVRPYVPEARILSRQRKDKAHYDQWARDGFLRTVPGEVIDQDFITADIQKDAERFRILGVGFDPWNASQMAIDLEGLGFVCVEVRQGPKSMSEASKDFEAKLIPKLISHMNHPVLRYCASNALVRKDSNENIMPDKDKSTGRIDMLIAAIIAVVVSRLKIETRQESPYKKRGIRTF